YSGMGSVYIYTDIDPNNSANLIGFYSGTSATWPGSFATTINREHVWPNSRGGSAVENDPHMTRPTLKSENSARGNSFFNVAPTSWDPGTYNLKYRGIAARIIMYCAVKAHEAGLKLVDLTNDSTGNNSMGKLSDLLQWNLDYPIDATEIQRNEALVAHWGHCRNPFIDDRNYGCKIWGSTNATTKSICGMA
ncbi:MAG: endonuclease, partial [Firmicutes bacterium]|nr:endonuclease [Bacillota bacterium]